jgi:sulfur carrier protein
MPKLICDLRFAPNLGYFEVGVVMSQTVTIQVNGENRETPAGTTLTALLAQLGLNSGRVAIEYNLQVLPKSKWDETHMANGDRVEIVQFVGGG